MKPFRAHPPIFFSPQGIPLKDDHGHEQPAVQARKHGNGLTPISLGSGKSPVHTDMTSLEIGMYVLLTAFCLAIGVFVISCVVYASKFRPVTIDMVSEEMGLGKDQTTGMVMMRDSRRPRESTTNAHDWVWLGRATMDRSNPMTQQDIDARDARMRITSNPMPLNYVDPNDAVNGFDNPNAIELPSKPQGSINTATYTKRDRRSCQRFEQIFRELFSLNFQCIFNDASISANLAMIQFHPLCRRTALRPTASIGLRFPHTVTSASRPT